MSESIVLPAAEATTSTSSTTGARPASSYGAHDPSKPPVKRQVVAFSFYKVMPEWRRLSAQEKSAHKAEFAAVLAKWEKPGEFISLT
ncbi:MAG: chlorite dismutase, partial [Edaphobacter sp.]